MKFLKTTLFFAASIFLVICLISCERKQPGAKFSFGSGPIGGTFVHFANAISFFLSKKLDIEISTKISGGSAANLKMIDRGNLDFGIVYAGDAFLGRKGELPNDPSQYTHLRLISFLYSAPAQLVTLKSKEIKIPQDLIDKKIAVGNAGSGAALSAERYFKAIKIWDKIKIEYLGYSAASEALKDGKIHAFWVLAGYPNSSISDIAAVNDIILIDLADSGEKSGFLKEYPFYSKIEIPAKVYKGQNSPVRTFQDSALWATNDKVSADIIYNSLNKIYTTEGLRFMISAHRAAKSMSVENGLAGMVTPLHSGAEKFWREKGLQIPNLIKSAAK